MEAPSRVPLDRWIERLARFPRLLGLLVEGVEAPDARLRPAPGAWCLTEIVGHLLDEEQDDFRPRLKALLEDPGAPWPPIDPEAAVRERRHAEASLDERLAAFSAQRRLSVEWLAGLESPDLSVASVRPNGTVVRAGDLLAAWAAHDALHTAQIARWWRARIDGWAAPFDSAYAG